MANYKDFKNEAKRRRSTKLAVCAGLAVFILLLLVAVCYVAGRMFMGKPLFDKSFTDVFEAKPVVSQSEPSSGATSGVQPDVNSGAAWNTNVPIAQTINVAGGISDSRIYALPSNGCVNTEYFKNCLFIGDSITQGLDMSFTDTLMDKAMFSAFKGVGPQGILKNFTAPNSRGESVAMLDDIFAKNPENIYVLLGTNIMESSDDAAILKYYGDLLDVLRGHYPTVPIYVQSITPVTADTNAKRPQMGNERIRALNNELAKLAHDKKMYFLNLHEALANDADELPDELSGSDGYHLQPAGYHKWVDYLTHYTAYSPNNLQYLLEPYNNY